MRKNKKIFIIIWVCLIIFGHSFVFAADNNILINPFFDIDQEREGGITGFAITDGGWIRAGDGGNPAVTFVRASINPPPGASHYLQITIPQFTLFSPSVISISQRLSGDELPDLGYGTSNPKAMTLSWYQKCSVAGNFGYRIYNVDKDRSIGQIVHLSNANTWTLLSTTIPGDSFPLTSQNKQWAISLSFTFASTPEAMTSAPGQWNDYKWNYTTQDQTQLNQVPGGATCEIGEVKLEIGSSATPIVHRSLAEELALDQRFYVKTFPQGSVPAQNAGVTGALCVAADANGIVSKDWTWPVAMDTYIGTPPAVQLITTYNPLASDDKWGEQNGNTELSAIVTPFQSNLGANLSATGGIPGRTYCIHATSDNRFIAWWPPFAYYLANAGNKSVAQGSSTTNTISTTFAYGTSQPVSFSVFGLPAATTATFSPTSCNPTCSTTMTVNTAASTPVGNSTITVIGTAGSISRTTAFVLNVTNSSNPPPAVTFSANPTVIAPGKSSTLTWSSTNASSCNASGSWDGSKSTDGTQAVFPTNTSTYNISCTGSGGSVSKSVIVTVNSSSSSLTISNILATNITSDSATVTFTTNIPATAQVMYGINDSYNNSDSASGPFVSHSHTLSRLKPSTTYNLKVNAYANGNSFLSDRFAFTTKESGSNPNPNSNLSTLTLNLSPGSSNIEVKYMQQILNYLGYTVSTSGPGSSGQESTFFGSRTQKALQRFQCVKLSICSGSPATNGYGNLGPRTRVALNSR